MTRHFLWLLFVITGLFVSAVSGQTIDPFSQRYVFNTNGDIQIIGNTVTACNTAVTDCSNALAGTANLTNNNFNAVLIDIDSDSSTFNSSTATLDLPDNTTVLWAGLYWSARTSAGTGGVNAPDRLVRGNIRFKAPGQASYQTLTASELIDVADTTFRGFVEITSTVASAGEGVYTAANIQASTGEDRYGSWGMVVVYYDPAVPLRNLSVFDGFTVIRSPANVSDTISLSGFLTPLSGTVKTSMGTIAYEGDRPYTGDAYRLNTTSLTDSLGDANNFFNSTNERLGIRNSAKNPDFINSLGTDIDVVDASGILGNGATSATIEVTTGGETYYPGTITFVTDVQPVLDVNKTFVDINGGTLEPGDILEYTLVIDSTGVDTALQTVLRDTLPQYVTYVPGSTEILTGANAGVKTDALSDDQVEFDGASGVLTVRLGTGANGAAGGQMPVGATTSLKFRVTVDANIPNGFNLRNVAKITYVSQAAGTSYEDSSSVAAVTVANPDSDGDGIPNATDIDDDNDGILDGDEGTGDLDGDGIPNRLDIDSDNDGLPDLLESQGGNPASVVYPSGTDADGDGLDDAFDRAPSNPDPTASRQDYDKDGNTAESPVDSDGDGKADFLDIDSDNDGVTDLDEAYDTSGDGVSDRAPTGTDSDGDGLDNAFDTFSNTTPDPVRNTGSGGSNVAPLNSDGDSRPNHVDIDADNDGLTDFDEAYDTNGDGVADTTPSGADADNDGMDDGLDSSTSSVSPVTSRGDTPTNSDGDPRANHLDVDSDNDGVTDRNEAYDTTGDGRADTTPSGVDADNDGMDDAFDGSSTNPNPVTSRGDTPTNSDADGRANHLDIDADNDGIPDNIEAQPTRTYVAPTGADSDGDGLDNAYDAGSTNAGLVPVNTDGTDNADFLDLDSDNDTLRDVLEARQGTFTGTDSDNDGYDNGFDRVSGPDVNDDMNDPRVAAQLPDADRDAGTTGDADYRETDSDGDGIPDQTEAGGTPTNPRDTDGDGVPDFIDLDSDNDGIPDLTEVGPNPATPRDSDGDGVPDLRDLDSDNDGIPDVKEAGGTDTNGDGIIDGFTDADRDGLSDNVDPTNGGTAGTPLPVGDFDGDGLPNYRDLDADNDGILDVREAGGTDTNRDGIIDGYVDSDDDGYSDNVDSVNGGAAGTPLTVPNTDSSGGANYLDIDADNDGIPDNIEAQTTAGYIAPSGSDSDSDGVDNAYDTAGSSGLIPNNHDGSDSPDYLDSDSDNDSAPDVVEGGRGTLTGTDTDGDGLDNGFDTVAGPDVNDNIVRPATTLPDDDGDASTPGGNVDYRDTDDADGDGVADSVDLDDDNDGIPDTTEGTLDFDGDGVPNAKDRDSDNDSIPDVVEAGGTDANNDGVIDGFTDTDGDGLSGNVDPTTGGTPLPVPNTDGTTNPNYLDIDSDNDGISDTREAGSTPNVPVDTDGDGRPDYRDIDADNDGIPDNIEAQPTVGYVTPSGTDVDGDGLDDAYDAADSNVDPVASAGFTPVNTDGTDTPDYIDTDSDNDTLPDRAEGGRGTLTGTDTDGDGLDNGFDTVSGPDVNDNIATPVSQLPDNDGDVARPGGNVDYRDGDDNDRDGIPDSVDVDDDNDGIPDATEGTLDFDGDGIPNRLDTDSDNDSIPDVVEAGGTDANADGIIDGFTDTDRDGLSDNVDPAVAGGTPGLPLPVPNTDGGTGADYLDIDSDNDGISDTTEAGSTPNLPADTDGDGLADYRDIDADDDGIPDNIEAQPTVGYVAPSGADADADGLDDAYDVVDSSTDPVASAGFTPVNTDNADLPDYIDSDSDNDALTDVSEAGRGTLTGTDTDGDGLDDGFDTVTGGDVNDDITTPATDLPDEDGDAQSGGNVDYRQREVSALVGLAKNAEVRLNTNGNFDVRLVFTIRNYGTDPISNLQVTDDLASFYSNTNLASNKIVLINSTVSYNAGFNGQSNQNLLTGTDTLPVGATRTVTLELRDLQVTSGNTLTNSARVVSQGPDGTPVSDDSTNGFNPDQDSNNPNDNGAGANDNNTNPNDNTSPTPITLQQTPRIGVAKAADVLVNTDGSFDVTLTFTAENLGNVPLRGVQLSDDLTTLYNNTDLAASRIRKTFGALSYNTTFDGQSNTNLLTGGDTLAVGESKQLVLILSSLRLTGNANLTNSAIVSAAAPNGTPVSDNSTNGLDPDRDRANPSDNGVGVNDNNNDASDNTSPTPITLTEQPVIGVAKNFDEVSNNGDGTYTLNFTFTVRNYGNVPLSNVQVTDDLGATFGTDAFVVNAVSSTTLTANTGFNGSSNQNLLSGTDALAVNSSATVSLRVTVTPAAATATYSNSAVASATSPAGTPATDTSTDGNNPDRDTTGAGGIGTDNGTGINDNNDDPSDNNSPTPISLSGEPLLGLAKNATVTTNGDGSFDITMTFTARNYGNVRLDNLQLTDSLATFYTNTDLAATRISRTGGELSYNAGFNGQADRNLLTGTDVLAVNETKTLVILLGNVRPTRSAALVNTALARATAPGGLPVTDDSSNGLNPDQDDDGNPNNDGNDDPSDNDTPTPITLSGNPGIGTAKAATVTANSDGTFDISFSFIIENTGDEPLTAVQMTDDLSAFYDATDLTASDISSTGGDLSYNSNFDGQSDTNLLSGTDTLAVGQTKTLTILLNEVEPTGASRALVNTALAAGTSPNGTRVSDASNDGSDPDREGDGPADNADPTPISLGEAELILNKNVPAGSYTLGDVLTYTLTLPNTKTETLTVTVTDTPAAKTQYLESSAVITVTGDVPTEPVQQDGNLIWRDITVTPGETLTIRYQLRILAGAESPLRNTAKASAITGSGITLVSNEAVAQVRLNEGVFNRRQGVLVGRVYLDVNRNDAYDEGTDQPLPGARVILSSGWQALTDAQGNYGFRDVDNGTWSVLLDRETAPFTPRPHPETANDGYQHRVVVQGLTVSDFPLEPILGFTDAVRETTVTYGPITLRKYLVPLPDGVRVVLELSSSEAITDVELVDPQPDGSEQVFDLNLTTEPQTLTYDLPPGSPLTDPVFRRKQ
jgi:uncharacterized repeat protein (TIGR01451 family)